MHHYHTTLTRNWVSVLIDAFASGNLESFGYKSLSLNTLNTPNTLSLKTKYPLHNRGRGIFLLCALLLDRNVQNLELKHTCGNLNLDNLAYLLAKQCLSDRCADCELTLAQVCLVL